MEKMISEEEREAAMKFNQEMSGVETERMESENSRLKQQVEDLSAMLNAVIRSMGANQEEVNAVMEAVPLILNASNMQEKGRIAENEFYDRIHTIIDRKESIDPRIKADLN